MFVIGPIILLVVALSAGGAAVAGNSLEEKAKEAKQETTTLQEDRVADALPSEMGAVASLEYPNSGDADGNEIR